MQDSKENSWANNFDSESATDSAAEEQVAIVKDDATREADGWQQYRRWISKAPAPRGRRMGVDPSIYTWKGYRNWSEQIKRNWSDS